MNATGAMQFVARIVATAVTSADEPECEKSVLPPEFFRRLRESAAAAVGWRAWPAGHGSAVPGRPDRRSDRLGGGAAGGNPPGARYAGQSGSEAAEGVGRLTTRRPT